MLLHKESPWKGVMSDHHMVLSLIICQNHSEKAWMIRKTEQTVNTLIPAALVPSVLIIY